MKDGLVERFARLRAIGIKTIMCTGDNPLSRGDHRPGGRRGRLHRQVPPEDQIKVIKEEQARQGSVAMTGDGTNDAPLWPRPTWAWP